MKDEFEGLVEKYADTVTRICFSNLGSRDDAEDAWQNVFIKLFKAHKMWNKSDDELKKWLIRVSINECHDIQRKLFRRKHLDIDELQAVYTEDFNKELITAVRELPSKYRDVIALYYFEGYRTAEISAILSMNENTVRSRLKRGRELLKGELTDE